MHVVLDTEVYRNYFLAKFVFENGKVIDFERFNNRDNGDLAAIGRMLLQENVTLVTFNGIRYDLPILSMAMMGCRNEVLKEASDAIIKKNAWPWDLTRKYKFNILQVDHIDIIHLLPLFESLKLYAARIHAQHLQDLPYEPGETIDVHKQAELKSYCGKDCINTWELFLELWPEIELRIQLGHQYSQDLRSKSRAQIAEAVIKSEYEKITGTKLLKPIDIGELPKEVVYNQPGFISFETPALRSLLFNLEQTTFPLDSSGKPQNPDWLKRKSVDIGGRKYTVGLGGLHAKQNKESYRADDEYEIVDVDVTSYYPKAILNCGYEPKHMGNAFTKIYRELVDRRLTLKAAGDKINTETLKIAINGTFGKLGNKYSAIYAPQLMLGTTLTGQLSLLMLIEAMTLQGISCVSANTDGVTLKVVRKQHLQMERTIQQWEDITGFEMEMTNYKSIHFRDVNNYFAINYEGQIKTKGVFKIADTTKDVLARVSKNPTTLVTAKAAIYHVLHGTNIKEYIRSCKDVREFLSTKKVAGGAAKDGEYLGKAIRWYYSTKTDTPINYISNGNKVARTDGAMPMMDLTDEIPSDLDYQWYIDDAIDLVNEVGEEYIEWL